MAGVAIEGTRVLPEPGPAGTAASPASAVAVTAADSDERLIELWLYGRPKRTQRAYQADIAAFNRFVQKPLRQLTLGELQSYQDSLQHLATASQARRLSSIKSLLSFGQKTGYLTLNVGAAIFLPKINRRSPNASWPRTTYCECWRLSVTRAIVPCCVCSISAACAHQ
jgi:hypothetical protein